MYPAMYHFNTHPFVCDVWILWPVEIPVSIFISTFVLNLAFGISRLNAQVDANFKLYTVRDISVFIFLNKTDNLGDSTRPLC